MDAPRTPIDRRKLLASVPIFNGLAEREIDVLLAATTTKRLAARAPLFHKGDPANALYAVMRGRLKASVSGGDGKEIVFNLMGPGEVIGEVSLLDGSPRSLDVEAVEPSELLSLQRRDLVAILERHPKVAIRLAMVLAQRLRRLSQLTEDTRFLNLPARLGKKLLELAAAHGTKSAAGVRIGVKLPQHQLGEMVGTSRESVNKQLRIWVQAGWIRVEAGYITLVDTEEIETLAGLCEI
jgi:CRP-like cAMP-binding protein